MLPVFHTRAFFSVDVHPHYASGKTLVDFDCAYTETALQLLTVVPPPSDDDQTAYEPIVNQLRTLDAFPTQFFSYMTGLQSSVNLSIEATNLQLTKRLACALNRYSPTADSNTAAKLTLLTDVVLVREHFNLILPNVSLLQSLYTLSIAAGYQHNSTMTEAFKDIRSITTLEKILAMSPQGVLQWIGFDFTKAYRERWIETRKSLKEIQSGIAALEMASVNLVKTQQVGEEIKDELDHLAIILEGKDSQAKLQGGKSDKAWLKDWFRRYVARYVAEDGRFLTQPQFEVWWIKLGCWCSAWQPIDTHSRGT